MAVIDQYFKYLVEAGGSDLHLSEIGRAHV